MEEGMRKGPPRASQGDVYRQGREYEEFPMQHNQRYDQGFNQTQQDTPISDMWGDEDDGGEVYKPPKKSKNPFADRKIMIISVVVVILILGAVIAGTVFLNKEDSSDESQISNEGGIVDKPVDEMTEDEKFLAGITDDEQLNYYDEGTKKTLRSLGKTDEQIKEMEMSGILSDEAIKMSKKDLDDIVRDRYFEMKEEVFNTQGDSFHKLLRLTWLQGRDMNLEGMTQENIKTSVTKKENCDYIKVPARGCQCFLRVENPAGDVFFMEITPDDYKNKAQSGNIVVQYFLLEYKDGQKSISNISEIRVDKDDL